MKRLISVFVLVLVGFVLIVYLAGCSVSGKGKPDLVVVAFEVKGPVTLDGENRAVVPVHVAVKNRGSSEAGVFKIATLYTGLDGPHFAAFVVKGQSDRRYAYTRGVLKPGGEFVFNGMVVFHPSEQGMEIPLYAVADSCDADENMPSYCRVDEGSELNNKSDPVAVTLP